MKTALITGITGQDGSYLAELLLSKGYRVVGVVRRSSTESFERIGHIKENIELVQADLLDQYSLIEAMQTVMPDEVYNLAAQSHVAVSFEEPESLISARYPAPGARSNRRRVRPAHRGWSHRGNFNHIDDGQPQREQSGLFGKEMGRYYRRHRFGPRRRLGSG